jgi:hypothetical protein
MRLLRKADVESLESRRPHSLNASVNGSGTVASSTLTTTSGNGSVASSHATSSRPFALAAGGRTGGFFVRGR